MSQSHLTALEQALNDCGWSVVLREEGDDYRIAGTWVISHHSDSGTLRIDFDALGPDGECLPLEESYACEIRGRPETSLYFSRVNRSKSIWLRDLSRFIEDLKQSGN